MDFPSCNILEKTALNLSELDKTEVTTINLGPIVL